MTTRRKWSSPRTAVWIVLLVVLATVCSGLFSSTSAAESVEPEDIVSSAGNYVCGLKPDGTISCWGDPTNQYNQYGQFVENKTGPFIQAAAGWYHACGLKADGSVECWGATPPPPGSGGDHGQTAGRAGPFQQVVVGVWHTCALKLDGSVECWGWNKDGAAPPDGVAGPFVQITAGADHTCGLKASGEVECWGRTASDWWTVPLQPQWRFTQIDAGGYHNCGVTVGGDIACWGNDRFGCTASRTGPFVQASGGGQWFSCGLKSDHSVVCWGNNQWGQGTPPLPNPSDPPIIQISSGGGHTCGLKSDGRVVCWNNVHQPEDRDGPFGLYVPPDADDDGVCDGIDNCPYTYNPNQADADADNIGDACDVCVNDPDNDADGDSVCGNVDNCSGTYNPDQADVDSDGLGDLCDVCINDPDNDVDSDGICGDVDNCPNTANDDQLDTDGDGVGDVCDVCPFDPDDDADGDGFCGMNLLENGDFEHATSGWHFYTNGAGTLYAQGGAHNGEAAAQVDIRTQGTNVQLYQYGITLEPNQQYRLHFAAYSSNGRDMSVYIHQHGAPYTNYGLAGYFVDLGTDWQAYTVEFTTPDWGAPVNDARLRFWLAPYDKDDMTYRVDYVFLEKVTTILPPVPDPEPVDPFVPPEDHCDVTPGNVVTNGGFEPGTEAWNYGWKFYTNGAGSFVSDTDHYECQYAAHVTIVTAGSNVQVYQPWMTLQPQTDYRLRMAAKSSSGRDVMLFVHEHDDDYTNYGLNGVQLDLTPDWQVFTVEFTTVGFNQPVGDARLRIWLAQNDAAGESYWFDDVVMTEINGVTAATLPDDAAAIDNAAFAQRQPKTQRSGYFIDDADEDRLLGGPLPDDGPDPTSFCDTAHAEPHQLWPANGKFVPVTIGADASHEGVTVTIDRIFQDEPVGNAADGQGVGTTFARLRAERDGGGDGRVYHIDFTAVNGNRTLCTGTVIVGVPHDQAIPAGDGGPRYDSTIPSDVKGAGYGDVPSHPVYLPVIR